MRLLFAGLVTVAFVWSAGATCVGAIHGAGGHSVDAAAIDSFIARLTQHKELHGKILLPGDTEPTEVSVVIHDNDGVTDTYAIRFKALPGQDPRSVERPTQLFEKFIAAYNQQAGVGSQDAVARVPDMASGGEMPGSNFFDFDFKKGRPPSESLPGGKPPQFTIVPHRGRMTENSIRPQLAAILAMGFTP